MLPLDDLRPCAADAPLPHLSARAQDDAADARARLDETFARDVSPEKYKLFQVADLACTLELTRLKLEETGTLSVSEQQFFGGTKNFRKNFLKPLLRKNKP